MIRFETKNSVYEIDEDRQRVRRLSGANAPTENFGGDGEWRGYEHWVLIPGGWALFYFDDERFTITTPGVVA
jgi:hypothetical protein